MELANNKLFRYLSDSRKELKKVTWPTKKITTKHTLVVIGVSLAVAAFLGLLDLLFSYIIQIVVK